MFCKSGNVSTFALVHCIRNMKKSTFFLLSIFLIMSNIFAQNQVNPNGYNTFYYPNGVKSSEGNMVDGKPEGWWKSYNEKGTLVSEGNRKNSLLDSVWIFYNDSGDTTLVIHYKQGKKDGERIQFFQDERVVEQWINDSLTSPVLAYTPTGKLKRLTPYVDGVPHGMEKEFDTAGHIVKLSHYYRGVLTKREQINRTDQFGYKQGNWKYFWDNGNLRMEGTYVNDKRHGYFKEYDEDGNFLSVAKESVTRPFSSFTAPISMILSRAVFRPVVSKSSTITGVSMGRSLSPVTTSSSSVRYPSTPGSSLILFFLAAPKASGNACATP